MSCTVIEHGYVIPVAKNEVIEDGVVAFDGSRITYAGPRSGFDAAAFRADKVIDASGRAVLPGLVNTHTHLVGAYIKALTEDVPGKANTAGLYTRAFPVMQLLQPDDFYWGCVTHGMEMVMTGTTTISDTWNDEDNTGPAVRDLGARAALSEMIWETEISRLNATQMDRPWKPEMAARGLDQAQKLYENWHGKENGRITTRVSPADRAIARRKP